MTATVGSEMFPWFKENYSWIAISLSALALVVSLGSAFWTQTRAARAAKLATYQRLHESLIGGDASKGRRILFVAHKEIREGVNQKEAFPALGTKEWDSVNHALALYDTLGGYVDLDLVPRSVVMQGWFHPLSAIKEPVALFMDYRRSLGIYQPWSYLHALLREVQDHTCHCPECCALRSHPPKVGGFALW